VPFLAFELRIAPVTWVPVWAVQAPVCFVDAGQEQDEIPALELALIEGLAAGFPDEAVAWGGFPVWQA
jgi:hypothetical protein